MPDKPACDRNDRPRPKNTLAALAGLVVAGGLTVWWLQAGGVRQLQPAVDRFRLQVLGADPHQVRADQLRRLTRDARGRVQTEAEMLAELDAVIHALDRAAGREHHEQAQDRLLVEGLRQRLLEPGDHRLVTIGDQAFGRADLEHEAQLILDRHRIRGEYLEDLQRHQVRRGQQREQWRAAFREHRGSLSGLRYQEKLAQAQLETLALIRRRGPSFSLETSRMLSEARRGHEQLREELETEAVRERVLEELLSASQTPAADQLGNLLNPPRTIVEQIDAVLEGGSVEPWR